MGNLNICEYPAVTSVFEFFEEFSKIPRGSGNTLAIANYLVDFAKARGLEYIKDDFNNVIIKKDATAGYENRPTVILQGHTDIVADKIATSDIDLLNDGLTLYRDGDFIRAKETTLGADDGIAIAYALAILDSNDIPHPAIEALFTSDEETGLIGATNLDASHLSGKTMINIDSDEEGVFTVGCAGGLRMDLDFSLGEKEEVASYYSLTVSGLMGGHSGVEINKGRLNAIKSAVAALAKFHNVRLIEFEGGNADNAIPRYASVKFTASTKKSDIFLQTKAVQMAFEKEEAGIKIDVSEINESALAFCEEKTKSVILALLSLPSGVYSMEEAMPDMVETSMNVGIVKTYENNIVVSASLRSSKGKSKAELKSLVRSIGEANGAEVSERGEYPEWEFKEESHLRDCMKAGYKRQYGKEPSVITIHAGLECGIFSKKIEGLDCVSIGPDNFDIHTPDEHLSISSSARVFEFIKAVLREI